MKFSTLSTAAAVLLSGAAVSAQGLDDYPGCALQCIATHIVKTGCGLLDFKCSCKNKTFLWESGKCIAKNCTFLESLKAGKVSACEYHITLVSFMNIC